MLNVNYTTGCENSKYYYLRQWKTKLTSPEFALQFLQKISDSTSEDIQFYEPAFDIVTDEGTSQACVLAPDGSAVSVTGTINYLVSINGRSAQIIFSRYN